MTASRTTIAETATTIATAGQAPMYIVASIAVDGTMRA